MEKVKLENNMSLRDVMLEVESFLDDIHLYAYREWIEGKITAGPKVSKYWIDFLVEFDEDVVPDPNVKYLLEKYGCIVTYKKLKRAIPEKQSDSMEYEPGTRYPKKRVVKVHAFKVRFPRELIADQLEYNEDDYELGDMSVDLTDDEVDDAELTDQGEGA